MIQNTQTENPADERGWGLHAQRRTLRNAITRSRYSLVFGLEDLQTNDAFVSTVLQATQIAVRNHQDEKRAALLNAVINAALRKTPDDSLREMFLSWIDDLTIHHLILLQLFRNPQQWFKEHGRPWPGNIMMGGLSIVVEEGLPELAGKRTFYDQVWNDLNSRGLVNTGGLHTTMSAQGMTAKRTSELGDSFLDFVSPP